MEAMATKMVDIDISYILRLAIAQASGLGRDVHGCKNFIDHPEQVADRSWAKNFTYLNVYLCV